MPARPPPTRPDAFGAELRSLRESAGLQLDSIISETKISRRVLEALENGRFHLLPERVFSRNFVAQYVAMVGGDAGRMMALFDAAWECFLEESGSHPAAVGVIDTSLEPPVRWRFWIPIALSAVIVAAVGVVVLKDRLLHGRPAADSGQWQVARSLDVDQPSPPTPTVWPTNVAPPVVDETRAADEDDTVQMSLTVSGNGECWIRYRDREGRTGQQLLSKGHGLDIELRAPVLLTLGNAAAVTLRVGGEEYRDLGPPGQVVHTEVSRHGVVRIGGGGSSE